MTEVIITSWVDKYCVNRYQKSTIVLLNDVIRISSIYIWYLTANCIPLIQDCVAIIMFDQKGRCMVLTNQKADFFS